MRIPQGVILLWLGNEADIPDGWVRETLLDGLFPKGWGSQPVNQTGGSETHTHIGLEHCHKLSDHEHYIETSIPTNFPYEDIGGDDPQTCAIGDHYHLGIQSNKDVVEGGDACATINWANGSNIPLYKDVIFIKANSENAIIQPNIAALFDKEAPQSWTKPNSYEGKFLRGADTGNNAGGEGGSYTHTHDLSHSHTRDHRHFGETNWPERDNPTENCQDSSSGGYVAVGHGHNYWLPVQLITFPAFNYVFTSPQIQPIFKKLLIAYRTTNGILAPKGLIGLWLGDEASVPKGWVICDGRYWSDGKTRTPDLRNYFIKLTTDINKIGETSDGDAIATNSHDHPDVISHTHGAVSHNHGGSGGSLSGATGKWPTDAGGRYVLRDDHYHNITRIDPANVSLLSADLKTNGNPTDNQPPYRTVIFIQLEKVGVGGSAGVNLL